MNLRKRYFVNTTVVSRAQLILEDILKNDHESLEIKLSQLTQEEISRINKSDLLLEQYVVYPANMGYTKILEVFNKYKLNIHAATGSNGILGYNDLINILHAAVSEGDKNFATIQYLVNQGVDVNFKGYILIGRGVTPLEMVLGYSTFISQFKNTALFLLQSGAEVSDYFYETYLLPLLPKISEAWNDEATKFVNVAKEGDSPRYRMCDNNGAPYQTIGEKKRAEQHSQECENLFNEAVVYFDQKQFKEAFLNLNKVLQKKSNHAGAYLYRGMIHYSFGHHQKALNDLTHAITYNPKSSKAFSMRGMIYLQSKNYLLAINELKMAAELKPDDLETHYGLAHAYHCLGNYLPAIHFLANALLINPNQKKVVNNLKLNLLKLKTRHDISKAIGEIKLLPEFIRDELTPSVKKVVAKFYFNSADLHMQNENFYAAYQEYTRVIELDPDCAEAYFNRSVIRMKSWDYSEDIETDFSAAIRLNVVNDPDLYEGRGSYYLQKSLSHNVMLEKAISDFEQAIQLGSNKAELFTKLGLAYELHDQLTEAEASYQKAINIDAQYAEAYYKLANLQASKSQFKEAVQHYVQTLLIQPTAHLAYQKLVATCSLLKKEQDKRFAKTQIEKLPQETQTELLLHISKKRERNESEEMPETVLSNSSSGLFSYDADAGEKTKKRRVTGNNAARKQ